MPPDLLKYLLEFLSFSDVARFSECSRMFCNLSREYYDEVRHGHLKRVLLHLRNGNLTIPHPLYFCCEDVKRRLPGGGKDYSFLFLVVPDVSSVVITPLMSCAMLASELARHHNVFMYKNFMGVSQVCFGAGEGLGYTAMYFAKRCPGILLNQAYDMGGASLARRCYSEFGLSCHQSVWTLAIRRDCPDTVRWILEDGLTDVRWAWNESAWVWACDSDAVKVATFLYDYGYHISSWESDYISLYGMKELQHLIELDYFGMSLYRSRGE
jgi:hypothetical protein